MINLNLGLTVDSLAGLLEKFWQVSGEKITKLEAERASDAGTPVFTVEGQYIAPVSYTHLTLPTKA